MITFKQFLLETPIGDDNDNIIKDYSERLRKYDKHKVHNISTGRHNDKTNPEIDRLIKDKNVQTHHLHSIVRDYTGDTEPIRSTRSHYETKLRNHHASKFRDIFTGSNRNVKPEPGSFRYQDDDDVVDKHERAKALKAKHDQKAKDDADSYGGA